MARGLWLSQGLEYITILISIILVFRASILNERWLPLIYFCISIIAILSVGIWENNISMLMIALMSHLVPVIFAFYCINLGAEYLEEIRNLPYGILLLGGYFVLNLYFTSQEYDSIALKFHLTATLFFIMTWIYLYIPFIQNVKKKRDNEREIRTKRQRRYHDLGLRTPRQIYDYATNLLEKYKPDNEDDFIDILFVMGSAIQDNFDTDGKLKEALYIFNIIIERLQEKEKLTSKQRRYLELTYKRIAEILITQKRISQSGKLAFRKAVEEKTLALRAYQKAAAISNSKQKYLDEISYFQNFEWKAIGLSL